MWLLPAQVLYKTYLLNTDWEKVYKFEKNLSGFCCCLFVCFSVCWFFLGFFLRSWPFTTKTQRFLSLRTLEIDSASVWVDFNSHREKTETNSPLVLLVSATDLSSWAVSEFITLDWRVWEATNEELQFWHKMLETLVLLHTHIEHCKDSPPSWALKLESRLIELPGKTKGWGKEERSELCQPQWCPSLSPEVAAHAFPPGREYKIPQFLQEMLVLKLLTKTE